MNLRSWVWDTVLLVLASPILGIVNTVRMVRHLIFLYRAVQPAVSCPACGNNIPLIGFWKCCCGFTYQGHLLRHCSICGSLPKMVRCYRCQATRRLR